MLAGLQARMRRDNLSGKTVNMRHRCPVRGDHSE
nr:MAG TPA: hypothetical protein [Caudoviricetes sp.]